MVRDGFVEQMRSMNAEMQKTQEFELMLTKWIFDTFQVKLLRQMPVNQLASKLDAIKQRLKVQAIGVGTGQENQVMQENTSDIQLGSKPEQSKQEKVQQRALPRKDFEI